MNDICSLSVSGIQTRLQVKMVRASHVGTRRRKAEEAQGPPLDK
ncbi:hypothetical protein [Peribacillus muralis]